MENNEQSDGGTTGVVYASCRSYVCWLKGQRQELLLLLYGRGGDDRCNQAQLNGPIT